MKYCWEYTDDYLEYRSSLGLDTRNPRWYINYFSKYLKDNCPNETIITKEMMIPWCIARPTEKSYSFKKRMSTLRQFTIFIYSIGVCEFILDTSFTPKAERYIPYIFTDQELTDLFDTAIRNSVQDPEARIIFESRLSSSKYDPADPQADEPYFLHQIEYYRVNDDFPRIRRSNLPAAISNCTYSLSISGLQSWRQEQ